MPDKMKEIVAAIDANGDGIISPEEEAKALATLKQAEKNRDLNMQHKFSTYLNNTNNAISNLAF